LDPLEDNEIFWCTASEFWKDMDHEDWDIFRREDFYKYVLQIYFPKLYYIKKIHSYDSLLKYKKKLVVSTKQKKWGINFGKIDHFYNVDKTAEQKGNISSINLTIHTIESIQIPMDLIFKILHTKLNIPMIKYNPGKKREDIFRLYTGNYLSADGLKLPYLYVHDKFKHYKIKNIDKKIALRESLGIFIYATDEKKEMYCELYSDGRIDVKMTDINCSKKKVEDIIKSKLNKYLLNPINKFIKKSGFTYSLFDALTDDNIEIKNIKYRYKFKLLQKNDFQLNTWKDAINLIYRVPNTNFKTGKIEFYYIKVSSYIKSNALNAYILNYRKEYGHEEDVQLVQLLIDNNLVNDKKEAVEEIEKSKEDLVFNLQVYSTKKIEIRDSPGFKVTLFNDLNNTVIEYENINDYNYLEHIDIYTNYFYQNFLNVKEKSKIDSLLKDKFYKMKNITIQPDPKNEAIQDKAQEIIEEDEYDQLSGIKVYEEDTDDSDYEETDEEEEEEEEEEEDKEVAIGPSASESESDSDDGVYGNLDNIKLKGANNYFINKISSREPYLFAKRGKGKTFSFAKTCPANAGKTPVLITTQEKEVIDGLDAGNGIRSYDEYITSENGNHYICPRFWCISDITAPNGRSLSFQQVNEGKCGGWDAVIGRNSKKASNKKRIYEFTDGKYHEGVETNNFVYRQHYPGWQRKKIPRVEGEQGKENICIPCCYNRPTSNYIEKDWETKLWKKGKTQWDTAPQTFQRKDGKGQLPGVGMELINKKYNSQQLDLLNDGYRRNRPKKAANRLKNKKDCEDVKSTRLEGERTMEFVSKPIIESFPLKYLGQLGYLPLCIQKFFNYNNITECWISSKNSKLKAEKWCLLRMGMEKNSNLLACIGNILKYRDRKDKRNVGQIVTMTGYEGKYVGEKEKKINLSLTTGDYNSTYTEILKWLEFGLRKNIEATASHPENTTGENMFLHKWIEWISFAEYEDHLKNEGEKYNPSKEVIRKFTSMNKGNLYQMFKKKKQYSSTVDGRKTQVTDAIINFIKFLESTNGRDERSHEIFWDIITAPKKEGGCFFKDGVNLIILKNPKDDIVNKIEVICPNNNFSKNAYNENKETIILYTENNLYEPIYMVKRPRARSKKEWMLKKMFTKDDIEKTNDFKRTGFKITMQRLIEKIDEKCNVLPGIKNYEYEENKTLNKLLDYKKRNPTIKGRDVVMLLHNEDYQVISVVLKMKENEMFALPCAPSAIMNLGENVSVERYEKVITDPENGFLLNRRITWVYLKQFGLGISEDPKDVIVNGKIIGLRTNTNQVVLIWPPIDITEGELDEKINEKLEEYKIDTYIMSKYPLKDKDREKTIKRIKLESNFYLMYRNLFKILINKEGEKLVKGEIETLIRDQFKSYKTKIDEIKVKINDVMKEYIIWAKVEGTNISVDDLINCLGLDRGPCEKNITCGWKSGDCKYVFPQFNLMYPEKAIKNGEDEDKNLDGLYIMKLTDEIIRYNKIREYVLKNDTFLNFDKVEYKINENEIVIIGNMFYQIYVHDIPYIEHSDYITNYNIYDNVNYGQEYGKYHNIGLTIPTDYEFTSGESSDEEEESGESDEEESGESDEEESDNDGEHKHGDVVEEEPKEVEKVVETKPKKKQKSANKLPPGAIMQKYFAFYSWREYLLKTGDFKDMKIVDFKKIPIITKIRNNWIKLYGGKTNWYVGNSMGTKGDMTIKDEWKNSEFKDYRLEENINEKQWEREMKKNFIRHNEWGSINSVRQKGPDRFIHFIFSSTNSKGDRWKNEGTTVKAVLEEWYFSWTSTWKQHIENAKKKD
jgi:hypothetical protein